MALLSLPMLFDAEIISNETLKGDYRLLVLHTPLKPAEVAPGQFAHVAIPGIPDRVLRRPFSIHDVSESGKMSIVYKVVGLGTKALSLTPPGAECGVMAPLGNSFSIPHRNETPVIVAGGYGSAATYILAKKSPTPGKLLLGARSEKDVIIAERFEKIGFHVEISTDDGSLGKKGLVTELLKPYIEQAALGEKLRFYGCGPNPMLMAMAEALENAGLDGEVSLDQMMCCGVGACFACVEKIKDHSSKDGWRYARTCSEGPIFKASEIHRD